MKPYLVKLLVCPKCHGQLQIIVADKDSGEVKTGKLSCSICSENYPIIDFIPRFVTTDKYVDNFSFEWQKHRTTQLDSYNKNNISRQTFFEKTGFGQKDLKGKLVLDIGCGMGRFMEVASNQGAEVIGIDLSLAVESARDNLKNRKKCHFIQADIFHLPFKPEIFDAIFSIGVLHHTPNTKKAFLKLPPLLKSGGKLAIWVYGQNTFRPYDYFGQYWRRITTRLPKKLLYLLAHFAVPLYWTYKIPVIGTLINILIPYSTNPNWRWRILDTFDWYSPKYQWKHTYPEVIGWFEQAGLKVIKILKWETAVLGKK